MTFPRVRAHLGAAQPLELLLQHGHVDGGAVEAVLQHDELRRCNERRWRQADKKQHSRATRCQHGASKLKIGRTQPGIARCRMPTTQAR